MTAKKIANLIIECVTFGGGKVIACGNGGSASMASHFVGELLCKVNKWRQPLAAITLMDPGVITAIANDKGFKYIFSRQLEALGWSDDLLIIFSTSGKSENCLQAIKVANKMDMKVIEFPRIGKNTQDIQEKQLKLMHKVCGLIEEAFV